jgi:hypothetical protein
MGKTWTNRNSINTPRVRDDKEKGGKRKPKGAKWEPTGTKWGGAPKGDRSGAKRGKGHPKGTLCGTGTTK